MRILIVNTVRFRENGITAVIMNYYKNMDKSDMQIDFVVINEVAQKFRDEIEPNGSKIFYIRRNRNPIYYMMRLTKLIKSGNYDIVHIHGNSAMMLLDMLPAKIAGAKVRIAHSHNTTCDHLMAHRLLNPIFKKMYTHTLACSDSAGKWLFPHRDFTVLKNSIDLSRFRYDEQIRDEYRRKLGIEDKKIIGHIGNFIPQKNHAFLLEAFAEALKKDSNCVLLMLGIGVLMDEMKEKAKSLGIEENVIFFGVTFEAYGYMQAMDMFVFPSLFEGLALVALEAQASGLPCVFSKAMPEESKMSPNTEFLTIDDKNVWAERMVAASIDNRKQASNNAINELRNNGFDIKENAATLNEFYRAALL